MLVSLCGYHLNFLFPVFVHSGQKGTSWITDIIANGKDFPVVYMAVPFIFFTF